MKAIIIARVSTEEQKEAGNSLPAQIRRGEEYCLKNGYNPIEKISFDESAYKTKRDTFDKILKLIEGSKEKLIICFDKVDRLSRNVFDKRVSKLYELSMSDKIELHFMSDNIVINKDISAVEKFNFDISLGLANYYSNAISDNTRKVIREKLLNGKWIGQAPIGYINETLPNEKKIIKLDQRKAPFIKKMFELYATGGCSVKTLTSKMYILGLRSRNEKKLTPSVVHSILKNRFYIGIMTSKGKEYPHKYTRIISQQLFNQVQEVLASHGKKPVQYAAKPFALRGLIKCAKCGCSITPEMKIKPSGKTYTYYSCTNYKGKCKKVYVNEKELMKSIYSVLEALQMPQERVSAIVSDLKALNEHANRFHNNTIKVLQKEYHHLQEQDDKLLNLLIDASITKDIYDKKHKDIKEQRHNISIQMEEYTQADETCHITASTVFSLANRAREIFESSEPNEKRQILNLLLQNCRLSGRKLAFDLRSPYNVIVSTAHQPLLLLGQDSNL